MKTKKKLTSVNYFVLLFIVFLVHFLSVIVLLKTQTVDEKMFSKAVMQNKLSILRDNYIPR